MYLRVVPEVGNVVAFEGLQLFHTFEHIRFIYGPYTVFTVYTPYMRI